MTAITSLPKVEIGGEPLPQDLAKALGGCWVESSVNLPAAFHITFREAARLLMPRFSDLLRIGARVAVYAVAGGQGKDIPLVTGVVTGLETEYQKGNSFTVLRGFDHSFKMVRHRRAAGYYNKTAAEIVTELASSDGVETEIIEPTSPQYELITQPNISDWQFVQYLADISNMEADFSGEGLLRFRKAKPAVSGIAVGDGEQNPRVLEFDDNMLLCRTGVTASDQVSMVRSRGWDEDEKKLLVRSAGTATCPDIAIGTSPGEIVHEFGRVTLTEIGTPYGTSAETDRAADSLAADVTSAFAELEIEVRGQPDLVPGLVVALKDAGPPFDGKYTVTATRHVFDDKNRYTTWVWVTGRQVRTLYGLASGGQQPAPRIDGVVNAIVTDINDPKEQGRVKLRFPWFNDTYVTDWVRTVQFGGYRGGGVISPEVDDEVLVAFDRGVLDYPYVLGGLYSNDTNKPSHHDTTLQTGGRLNRRSLVSRSGQRLEILDAEGKTGVRLRSGDEKLTVFLEETQTKITISSDGTVDISGTGAVNVTSKERLTLDAPAISISGDSVSIKGITSITGALTQTEGPVEIDSVVNVNGSVLMDGDVIMNGFVAMNGGAAVTGDMTVDGQQVLVV
jgi:uncharacterized protein involved in type VI secretion and phage assembly